MQIDIAVSDRTDGRSDTRTDFDAKIHRRHLAHLCMCFAHAKYVDGKLTKPRLFFPNRILDCFLRSFTSANRLKSIWEMNLIQRNRIPILRTAMHESTSHEERSVYEVRRTVEPAGTMPKSRQQVVFSTRKQHNGRSCHCVLRISATDSEFRVVGGRYYYGYFLYCF